MQKLVDTVNSAYGTGLPMQAKLLKLEKTQWAGRIVAIYPKTANTIVYSWSDTPYTTWSNPVNIVTDAADYPASSFMDEDGNIYLVYTVQSSLALNFVKLSFNQGSWNIGTVYTVVNVGQNYYPSIVKDSLSRLYVSWSYYDSVNAKYFVQAKTSTNEGQTWGTGTTDLGTALTSGSSSCYSQLIFLPAYVYCIYTDAGTDLAYRRIEISSTTWSSSTNLYSGSSLDYNFQAGVSGDNRIGVAWKSSAGVFYREYNTNTWSGVFSLDTQAAVSVNLKFFQNVPYVFWLKNIGTDQNQVFYSYKTGENFVPLLNLQSWGKVLDKVFCFDNSATSQFSDKTQAASDTVVADIFHPTSNAIVKDSSDAVYFGNSEKFSCLTLILSTSGSGGEVVWQYWNGSAWSNFTPYSGVYNFDSTSKFLILWQDLNSAPSDWQKNSVNSTTYFWVRAVVTTNFATGPVGTQITTVAKNEYLNNA